MTEQSPSTKWPKIPPALTKEQIQISNDWMQYFHEINRDKFSGFIDFGHKYVAGRKTPEMIRSLEIGAGLGAHLRYELDSLNANYVAVEMRWNMARELNSHFPQASCLVVDCQGYLPFKKGCFDRVLAIHVLEHLPDLPSCLRAVRDVLKPSGSFLVVIPAEGGIAYEIARFFTSKRLFEKRYKTAYAWHIKSEHVNTASEIIEEIKHYFHIIESSYYPFHLPFIHLNAVIGLTLVPK